MFWHTLYVKDIIIYRRTERDIGKQCRPRLDAMYSEQGLQNLYDIQEFLSNMVIIITSQTPFYLKWAGPKLW